MLEEMGETRAARCLVNGADLEAEIHRDGWGLGGWEQRQLQAIGQAVSDDGETGGGWKS